MEGSRELGEAGLEEDGEEEEATHQDPRKTKASETACWERPRATPRWPYLSSPALKPGWGFLGAREVLGWGGGGSDPNGIWKRLFLLLFPLPGYLALLVVPEPGLSDLRTGRRLQTWAVWVMDACAGHTPTAGLPVGIMLLQVCASEPGPSRTSKHHKGLAIGGWSSLAPRPCFMKEETNTQVQTVSLRTEQGLNLKLHCSFPSPEPCWGWSCTV